MPRMLTDITILMIVRSLPDYVQGVTKLFWIVSGRTRPAYSINRRMK